MRVTVDIVIYTIQDAQLCVLLVKRRFEPFKDQWAIPGGFVTENESLEAAAQRELHEETGLTDVYMEQLYTFGEPLRDPRERIVSVAYFALVATSPKLVAGSDAGDAAWFPVNRLPFLAFDHAEILQMAYQRLCNKLEYTTAAFELLPAHFTLSQLQSVFEAVLGKKIDKRNFRRKVELLGILEALDEFTSGEQSRPARLYRLSVADFQLLKDKGTIFPFFTKEARS